MPRISRALYDEMVAHAREDLPNEACGVIHASAGVPTSVHRVRNTAASPYRYEMYPLQQLRLEEARDAAGETLFAIYHSHVASEARPSGTDLRMAFFPPNALPDEPAEALYPGTYYILVSLAQPEPDVRAWLIPTREDEPIYEPIEIV